MDQGVPGDKNYITNEIENTTLQLWFSNVYLKKKVAIHIDH